MGMECSRVVHRIYIANSLSACIIEYVRVDLAIINVNMVACTKLFRFLNSLKFMHCDSISNIFALIYIKTYCQAEVKLLSGTSADKYSLDIDTILKDPLSIIFSFFFF